MGQAIPVRTDYTAGEVRRAQARRLLAIAAALDGAPREEAATIGGMDRQTLRDWVIRFNEQERTVSSISLLRECRPSSTPGTRPFSLES